MAEYGGTYLRLFTALLKFTATKRMWMKYLYIQWLLKIKETSGK